MHVAAKIGIGVGVVAGAGLLLAACGSEKDPQSKVLDEFQPFDRNRDNAWSGNEVKRFEVGRPYSTNHHILYRVSDDYVMRQSQIVHRESSYSMEKAYAAARGNDGLASLAELVKLASSFDKDGNGTLSGGERRAFDKAYGVEERSRTILDRTETNLVYSPIDRYPSGGGGHTSPGDDYGNGGGSGGGSTSPGDDYGSGGGYTPPSSGGGTSPGDSGGSGGGSYDPPSYDPPSSGGSGNSTDNGNPAEDDF